MDVNYLQLARTQNIKKDSFWPQYFWNVAKITLMFYVIKEIKNDYDRVLQYLDVEKQYNKYTFF